MRRLSRLISRQLSTQAQTQEPIDLFNPTPFHSALRSSARRFAQDALEPGAKTRDVTETFDRELFQQAGKLGFLGITVPEEFGGSGLDALSACIVHEEMSAVDPGFTLSYLAHAMLFCNNLARNGNQHQKMKFLPRACLGESLCGMGMSEPGFGTDVLGMQTKGKKDGQGNWRLNGRKFWITNGTWDSSERLGDAFLVYAKTSEKNLSLFLVEKGMKGFSLGQRIKNKCGMRASGTAELVFDDVVLPPEALVGEQDKAVVCMMRNLEIERVTLAAMATGIAGRCLTIANRYASERVAFGKPIRSFGQIQKHLAEAYASYMAGRTYLYNVAGQMNIDKEDQRLDTDGVKLVCTTMAKNVADSAIQVLGGAGYVADYPVERLWRDSKLLEIGGGTLESHHKNMAKELERIDSFL